MLCYCIISLILIVLSFGLWYRLVVWPYNYWLKHGVCQGKPYPVFGDKLLQILRRESLADVVQRVYNYGGDVRYTGAYDFSEPVLVLKDPNLIKQITVKDFDYFVDHKSFVPEDDESVWANNLFFLKGQKWRKMRNALTPAFTSSKMKSMFVLMEENSQKFVRFFLKKSDVIQTIEMKDIFTRFTNDVIASAAFGIGCNSLEDPHNEFYVMGNEITDFSGIERKIRIIGYFIFPKLYKLFSINIFAEHLANFFINLITASIRNREENGIKRSDMINVLMDARKNAANDPNTKYITDKDIASQAIVFFFAGFDSVSSLLCFMSYELALNQDVQRKLQQEIDEVGKNSDNHPTYEDLLAMRYLEMVISETLRKWPATAMVDRVCVKPYKIAPETLTETEITFKVGDKVWLPFFALHRDPKNFPEPEKFDPERFNDDNKPKIAPYTYLPFGSGPRNCIGARFALLETKTLIFYLLLHFELVPVAKTAIPLKVSTKSFNLNADGGFWLGLKRRF